MALASFLCPCPEGSRTAGPGGVGENASSSEAGLERQNACYPYFSDDEGEAGRGFDSF